MRGKKKQVNQVLEHRKIDKEEFEVKGERKWERR